MQFIHGLTDEFGIGCRLDGTKAVVEVSGVEPNAESIPELRECVDEGKRVRPAGDCRKNRSPT